MLKPGKKNKHGQEIVGETDKIDPRSMSFTPCIGYGLYRAIHDVPDFVTARPQWMFKTNDKEERIKIYNQACKDMRGWALSCNPMKDIKWVKQTGSLAPDPTRENTYPVKTEYQEVPMEDADGCITPIMSLYVMQLRDGI